MDKLSRTHIRKMIIEALGDRGDLPKKHQYRIGLRGPEDLPHGDVTGAIDIDDMEIEDFPYIPDEAFIDFDDDEDIEDLAFYDARVNPAGRDEILYRDNPEYRSSIDDIAGNFDQDSPLKEHVNKRIRQSIRRQLLLL